MHVTQGREITGFGVNEVSQGAGLDKWKEAQWHQALVYLNCLKSTVRLHNHNQTEKEEDGLNYREEFNWEASCFRSAFFFFLLAKNKKCCISSCQVNRTMTIPCTSRKIKTTEKCFLIALMWHGVAKSFPAATSYLCHRCRLCGTV